MPCTKHKDQDQRNRLISIRSNFTRPFAGLRFSEQNLQSFSISLAYHPPSNHPPASPPIAENSPSSSSASSPHQSSPSPSPSVNLQDPTDRVSIGVQDSHYNQQAYVNSIGGNVSDVLDSFVDDHATERQNLLIDQGDSEESDQADTENRSVSQAELSEPASSNEVEAIASQSDAMANIYESWPTQSDINTNTSDLAYQSSSDETDEGESEHCVLSIKSSLTSEVSTKVSTCNAEAAKCTETTLLDSNCSSFSGSPKSEKPGYKIEYPSPSSHTGSSSTSPPLPSHHDKSSALDTTLNLCSKQLSLPSYHQTGVIKNPLYNGSSFSGFQKSDKESYEVNVKIQYVDYESSYLCGYLCINHLTTSHPSLTTFFEGEIISKKYPFLTRRKWGASEEMDRIHWSKFEHFSKNYRHSFNLDNFSYDDLENSDYIYMRWKEIFLVPDHTIKQVQGASYAGFYYICYSKRTSSIRGYYFHVSEYFGNSFQSLNLELDVEPGTSEVFEFR